MKKKLLIVCMTVMVMLVGGAWTTSAKALEPAEEPIDESIQLMAYSGPTYEFAEGDIHVGGSVVHYEMRAKQAGWNATDRVLATINVPQGYGPKFRMKVKYYWGNGTVDSGSEVLYQDITLGSTAYSETLWCDHGGIPTNTGTSNKRWNCNFAIIWMQCNLNGVIENAYDVINFFDGEKKDSFIYNHHEKILTSYYNSFAPWTTGW